jgi:hypothetical protein
MELISAISTSSIEAAKYTDLSANSNKSSNFDISKNNLVLGKAYLSKLYL